MLNRGLEISSHDLLVTVDGGSRVHEDALEHIVERYVANPTTTHAVAGSVLVRNSRRNWITAMQEWDCFHGIAAMKRMQSMYHGTLVAQAAFSLYHREALEGVGRWPDRVGEDIVRWWALLERGWRIGYCEDSIAFTNVPDTLAQFTRQHKRWSRGLLEACKAHPRLLLKPRMTVLFIWWNALFPPLDAVYTFAFLPGVFVAFFGIYWIVGPMTLAVLPLAGIWNGVIFRVQRAVFKREDLQVRRSLHGFLLYALVYTTILQPVCVWGYFNELAALRKRWRTK